MTLIPCNGVDRDINSILFYSDLVDNKLPGISCTEWPTLLVMVVPGNPRASVHNASVHEPANVKRMITLETTA